MGFLIRWIFALLLLVLTYNPSFSSYSTWVTEHYTDQLPLAVLGALVLIAGYLVYLRATLNSIGIVGMVLILALVGAILWVLFSLGWLTFGNYTLNTWVFILALSLVLAIGMYWSVIWRRISGQVDVDEVDTN
jgi:drug/metabolite transporter (DMT)-like permease